VIPSHNRLDLLRRCLHSVKQHAPQGTEVIVVDDGSPAGAASIAAGGFAGVRVVRLPRRQGFSAAANAGLSASTGTVVELLNDDTEVTAGWATAALSRFHNPAVAAVAPLVLLGPAEAPGPEATPVIDSAGDRYYLGGIAAKRGHGERLGPTYLRPCRVFGASAAAAFYRRSAVLHVGAFPESFGAYFEDVDLSFRLHRAGYEVVFEPAARVWHHGSSSYGQSRRLVEEQSCNEERVFWRNLPGPVLVRALPRHGLVLAAKAWRRWREGNLMPFLWGRLRSFREMPTLLLHRRRLHGSAAGRDWRSWCVEDRYWG
jgi:GT2 family glycosyltransferase